MTAEELLWVRDVHCRHELIDGRLIELPFCGMAHGLAAAAIGRSLSRYVDEHALGETGAAGGFHILANPDTVLGADIAFVAADRVVPTVGYYPGAPDLVIEVVNFDETHEDVERRVERWIRAHVRLAIVVDPHTETVVSVTSRGRQVVEVVTGEDVVPGWSIPVRDIFG